MFFPKPGITITGGIVGIAAFALAVFGGVVLDRTYLDHSSALKKQLVEVTDKAEQFTRDFNLIRVKHDELQQQLADANKALEAMKEAKANTPPPAKEVDLSPLLAKLAVIEAKIPTPEQSAQALLAEVMAGVPAKNGEDPIEVSLQVSPDGSTAVRWDKKE